MNETEILLYFSLLAFTIAVISRVLRDAAEMVAPTLSKQTELSRAQLIWENFALKILPCLIGLIIGWKIKAYPYPEGVVSSTFARICYGFVAGACSQWAYQLGKAVIYQRWNIEVPKEDQAQK